MESLQHDQEAEVLNAGLEVKRKDDLGRCRTNNDPDFV